METYCRAGKKIDQVSEILPALPLLAPTSVSDAELFELLWNFLMKNRNFAAIFCRRKTQSALPDTFIE